MTTTLTAAVLIVSETASKDPSTDKCEPILRELFASAKSNSSEWAVADVKIVPDDPLRIQQAVTQWTDKEDFVNLVVTSGGTGFTGKDVTPEVCNISHLLALMGSTIMRSFDILPRCRL